MIDVGYPFLKQTEIVPCQEGTFDDLKKGCNAFTGPHVSAGFMADWDDPKWAGDITLGEVTSEEASS